MIALLEQKRPMITEICARFSVACRDAFGSAVRNDFHSEQSDVDLLVEFGPMEPNARVDAYLGMRDAFKALLKREIDLVVVAAVTNPFISREIERTKEALYGA